MTTEHSYPKVHTHTMDITNVPIGEMIDNSGKVMGEAHRAVPHEYKESKQNQNKNKNNGLENTLEGKENMSSKAHQDFCESLNPANYGKEKGPDGSKNNGNRQTSGNKAEDGGRERGDEGHGNHGRESDFKSGSKSNSNVSRMRADMMKTGFNTNSARGELSKNGHAVNNSGKAVTPAVSGKSSGIGTIGHGNSSSNGFIKWRSRRFVRWRSWRFIERRTWWLIRRRSWRFFGRRSWRSWRALSRGRVLFEFGESTFS